MVCSQEARSFQPEDYFDTEPSLLGRAFNRPRRQQLDSSSLIVGGSGGADASRSAKKAAKCAPPLRTMLTGSHHRLGGEIPSAAARTLFRVTPCIWY